MMKNRFGKGRHRKFQDDWERSKEPVLEGVTFYAKYLGMCLVSLSNDETHTAEAVKRIIHNAKYHSKLLFKKVSLTVTPKAIIQTNLERPEDVQEVSIHRISYCAADKTSDNKVFAFIANNSITEALECHAYLCSKRKIAEALTLTVAQAFNIAFELWEREKEEQDIVSDDSKDAPPSSPLQKSAPQSIPSSKSTSSSNGRDEACWSSGASPALPPSLDPPPSSTRKVLKVQAEMDPISASAPCTVPVVPPRRPTGMPRFSPCMVNGNGQHDSGIDSSLDSKEMDATAKLLENWHIGEDVDLDESFSKLAECRSNPQLLDINVRRTQFDADIIVHFQGNKTERDQLLESRSSENFQFDLQST
ncbi:low density lipoprotein receptor adapter protein 1-B-like [Acanthaster planci]|uniref:Low density lipoprotein receptor adapter protein 1-B-like n=1 Tax=Acanthaster planci TaxID=133434 RepID=A0A8B7ZV72_ACAPL|nr:low density lipoprotein receptor adapter protein 1-B-like [Acanthaster planci]